MNIIEVLGAQKRLKMHPLKIGMVSWLGFVGAGVANAADEPELKLEEIVVTAQRRSESMQEVPVSMTAFTAADLKDIGATRFESFTDFIPNVNFNTNSSIRATQITIRGIVSDANSVGVDQAAGVYVDGVYMGRPTTINTGVFDVERVEVLRGPQGTLYGKNVIAGAINMITRRPSEEFEGDIALTYGNFDNTIIAGTVSGPLVAEKLLLRVSGQYEKRDGFLRNLAGPDNNDADNINGRFSLLFQPDDDVEFILRGDVAKDRTNQGASEVAIVSPIFAEAPFNVTPGHPHYVPNDPFDYTIADSPSSFQDRDVWGGSLEANWTFDSGILTSITAYREFTWNNYQSSDYSPFDIFGTGIAEEQDQFSQEVRFSSGVGDKFEYVVGAYYFNMNLAAEPTAIVGVDAFSIPAFGGAPLGSFPGPSVSRLLPVIDNESYAFFGQGHYNITDKLTLTAGLRYTREEKAIHFSVDPDSIIVNPINPEVIESDLSKGVLSPMMSISYDVNDDVHTYVTYARGFKSGGYNAFDFDFSNDDGTVPEFAPEFVDSYEVGMKTMLLDDRLRLNVSAFYMDYTDLQVNQRLEDANGLFFFRTSNAGKAESLGFEVEMIARVTEGLDVTASYGYVDAEYKDFLIDAQNGVDYTGNTLVLSPKTTAAFSAQYVRPVSGDWDLLARGEFSYRSSSFSDQANTATLTNDSRVLVNARLGFENRETGIRIVGWVRNLFKEEYTHGRAFGSGTFSPGALRYNVGDPRTYGVEVSYSF